MIFPFVWRILPGPALLKVFLALVLIAACVWGCFESLFPWLTAHVLPAPDGSVGTGP